MKFDLRIDIGDGTQTQTIASIHCSRWKMLMSCILPGSTTAVTTLGETASVVHEIANELDRMNSEAKESST